MNKKGWRLEAGGENLCYVRPSKACTSTKHSGLSHLRSPISDLQSPISSLPPTYGTLAMIFGPNHRATRRGRRDQARVAQPYDSWADLGGPTVLPSVLSVCQ